MYAIHSHYGILYEVGELSTYLCDMNFFGHSLWFMNGIPNTAEERILIFIYIYQMEYYCVLICKINIMLMISNCLLLPYLLHQNIVWSRQVLFCVIYYLTEPRPL